MSTFAIVKINGKQFLAQAGKRLVVDRLAKKEGASLSFSDVLLVSDGKHIQVGTPNVKGASVEAKVLSHPRGTKGLAFRYRPKKRERRSRGFRADLTELSVTAIKA